MNSDKYIYVYPKKISLYHKPLKLVNQFIYLGSIISSTESDVRIRMGKAWRAIGRVSTRLKSDLSDKTKLEFFQVVAV